MKTYPYIDDIDTFCDYLCDICTTIPDGRCSPPVCDVIKKARKMSWEVIDAHLNKYDDVRKTAIYIKRRMS